MGRGSSKERERGKRGSVRKNGKRKNELLLCDTVKDREKENEKERRKREEEVSTKENHVYSKTGVTTETRNRFTLSSSLLSLITHRLSNQKKFNEYRIYFSEKIQ